MLSSAGAHRSRLREGCATVEGILMHRTILRILPRVVMALFLAAAMILPNYSKAVESTRLQNDYLSSLFNSYLADFGAQEAHAIAPVIVLPAALTAAGVTPAMAAAAFAAICTAVGGVSLGKQWGDLTPAEKQLYGTPLGYSNYVLDTFSKLYGYWEEPPDDGEPPEPNGDKGNKLNALLIALTVGGGAVVMSDLADAAGHLIDFISNPFGKDESGNLTGLGAYTPSFTLLDGMTVPPIFISSDGRYPHSSISEHDFSSTSLVSMWISVLPNGHSTYLAATASASPVQYPIIFYNIGGVLCIKKSSFSFWYLSGASKLEELYWSSPPEGNFLVGYPDYIPLTSFSGLTIGPNTNLGYVSPSTSGANASLYNASTKSWNTDLGSLSTVLSAGIPPGYQDLVDAINAAGAGSPAAETAINNFVTNNIANNTQTVTVPPTFEETDDYDKVVTSPAPNPDPDPDPDPDPTPDPTTPGSSATIQDFLKLPIEKLFPFCLVYDIQLLIEHLAGSSPSTFSDSLRFEFNLGFGFFDAPLVIDLSDYRDMQGSFHTAFTVIFVTGLLYFSIGLFLKTGGR